MTINTAATVAVNQGNGVTSTFNYSFLIPSPNEVNVFYTDVNGNSTLLSPSLYTITGLGNPAGGTVIYPLTGSPIAIGTILTIARNLPLLQLTTISNQGAFYPAVVESALDYITMLIQQLSALIPGNILPPTITSLNILPSIAALRANHIFSTSIYVLGYSTLNDGGEGLFVVNINDTTTPDNGGTVIVDAVGYRWYRADSNQVPASAKWFGAKGDGITDDTAALQEWLNLNQSRYLPTGTYLISGNSDACLVWSNGGTVEGGGDNSILLVSSSVPNTVDGLTLRPNVGQNTGWALRNLAVQGQTNSSGRNGIELNLPTDAQYLSASDFYDLTLGRFDNGRSFNLDSTLIDGFFTSTIARCLILGGIRLVKCGDTINIRDNQFSGYLGLGGVSPAIEVDMVTGASGPIITGNNITTIGTSTCSGISITGGIEAVIDDNIIEANILYGGAAPLVLINNANGVSIRQNVIGGLTISNADIKLTGTTTKTKIAANYLLISASAAGGTGVHVYIDNNVIGNYIENDNIYVNTDTGLLVDIPILHLGTGVNPNYGVFAAALVLVNGWSGNNLVGNRSGIWCTKDSTGQVTLAGGIGGGTTTALTLIATLPANLRPANPIIVPVPLLNSTTWTQGVIEITTSGQILVISFAGNTFVSFDSVNFPVF